MFVVSYVKTMFVILFLIRCMLLFSFCNLYRFLYVPPPHNADVLSKTLLDNCIYDSNLDLRLSTITLDNCTTNDAVKDELWEKLPFDSLILGGQFFICVVVLI